MRVVTGSARFTGPDTLDVDGRTVRFRRALVSTGAGPAVPPVPGLREAQPLTSETVWDLDRLPARLLVMGGGSIGCELAQAFARLGSEVTLVEALPRILSREDPDAARLVHGRAHRGRRAGGRGHRVAAVRGGGDSQEGEVVLDGRRTTSPFDRLLVAVGRRPHTAGLGTSTRPASSWTTGVSSRRRPAADDQPADLGRR